MSQFFLPDDRYCSAQCRTFFSKKNVSQIKVLSKLSTGHQIFKCSQACQISITKIQMKLLNHFHHKSFFCEKFFLVMQNGNLTNLQKKNRRSVQNILPQSPNYLYEFVRCNFVNREEKTSPSLQNCLAETRKSSQKMFFSKKSSFKNCFYTSRFLFWQHCWKDSSKKNLFLTRIPKQFLREVCFAQKYLFCF